MMFLAVDIGNTGTKFGLFKQDEPFEMTFRFLTSAILNHEHIEDELLPKLSALGDLSSVAIASVVPKASEALIQILQKAHFEAAIKLLTNSDIPIVNKYRNPNEVGIDRLLASYAAYRQFGQSEKKPVIVISFGTATTFDCINPEGEYLGGIIALGVESSAAYLSSVAVQLPKIEIAFPESILGQSTVESIQSGIMNGSLAMVEGLISKLTTEIFQKQKPIVVAAGGLAKLFEGKTNIIDHFAPALVLEGIAILESK
jgi:type III pantothenate kinase